MKGLKLWQQILIAVIALISSSIGGAGLVVSDMVPGITPAAAEAPGALLIKPEDTPTVDIPDKDISDGSEDAPTIHEYLVFCNCNANYFRPVKNTLNNTDRSDLGYTDLTNKVISVSVKTSLRPGAIKPEFLQDKQVCGDFLTVGDIVFIWKQ